MKLYRITTKNNSELLIYADKVDVLNSGQIVLFLNNEVISIFCKETDIVCAEKDKSNYHDTLKYEFEKMIVEIDKIDEFFMTDVFLKKNTIEDAAKKLRSITGLVIKTTEKLSSIRI